MVLEQTLTFSQELLEMLNFKDEILSKYKSKVPVGATISEIKKMFGIPFALEGGFPDNAFFLSESEQHGQLNYTTWFYKLKPNPDFSPQLWRSCVKM